MLSNFSDDDHAIVVIAHEFVIVNEDVWDSGRMLTQDCEARNIIKVQCRRRWMQHGIQVPEDNHAKLAAGDDDVTKKRRVQNFRLMTKALKTNLPFLKFHKMIFVLNIEIMKKIRCINLNEFKIM